MIRRTLTVVSSSLFCATLVLGANAGQTKAGSGDPAKGKEVFEQCSVCHDVETGEKKMGPSLKGLFKRQKLQSGQPVNDENVLKQINNGGGGMPAYADMLSAEDKANVLAYLKTL
ncbi:MAG TPA: c-type cytochrome [Bryobacteraceae bacterium]|nr:c-type cytochrome [Bryobacteraceae bacterium]